MIGFDTFMYMKLINAIRAAVQVEDGPTVLAKIGDGSFWSAFNAQVAGDELLKVGRNRSPCCVYCILNNDNT